MSLILLFRGHNKLWEMKNKYVTPFDYFQAIFGIISFIVLIIIKFNFGTIVLGLIILMFALYKAFGRRFFFNEKNILVRDLMFQKTINYSDVKEVIYSTHLYGKPILKIEDSVSIYKAYINFSEWEKLKDWLVKKGIKCNENR